MISMKAVWRNNKNGFVFVFAINSRHSYINVIDEIMEIKESDMFRNVAIIMIGNKNDLEN